MHINFPTPLVPSSIFPGNITVAGTITGGGGTVVIGGNTNGSIVLGSTTLVKSPFITFNSTGTSTPGYILKAVGADTFDFLRGSDSGIVATLTEEGLNLTKALVYTGPYAKTNAFLWSGAALSGTTSTPPLGTVSSPNAFVIPSDIVDTGGTVLNGVQIEHIAGGAGMTGSRQALHARIWLKNQPTITNPPDNIGCVGAEFSVRYAVNTGGADGGHEHCVGAAFGINPQVICSGTSTFMTRSTGGEVNVSVESGSSAAHVYGLSIVQTSDHATRGLYDDASLALLSQDSAQTFKNGLLLGGYTGPFPVGTDGTIISANKKQIPNVIYPTVLNGVDFREVTFSAGGFAYSSPQFGVNPSGTVSTPSIIANNIQSQTATLTAVTIVDGGLFQKKPTMTIAAPPSGSTATLTVTTMGLHSNTAKAIQSVVAGGSGYTIGNTLTISGGTGTAPTIIVDTVDGGGAVLTAHMATQGSMSVLPVPQPTPVTGGTGASATFEFGWTILTVNFTAGSGYLPAPAPIIIWQLNPGAFNNILEYYELADLTLTMTPVASTLALQAAGGLSTFGAPVQFPSYTILTLPAAASFTTAFASVTNPTAGKSNLVYSNGVNWLYTDGSIAI